jgi:peptide/nickel transport system substrate-binding protein
MFTRVFSKRLVLFVGLIMVGVLALACAKSEEAATPAPTTPPTAAPAATPAPLKSATSATAPSTTTAPSAPTTTTPAPTSATQPVDGQPLVPGGPAFYPSRVSQLQGWQFLQKYHVNKLPLWTQAKYGGDLRGYTAWNPQLTLDLLGTLTLSRPTYSGMLLYTDSGRCSMQGREDFSKCNGKYSQTQAVSIQPGIFTKWVQQDPVTYVFTMRKGVLWPAIPPMARTDREVTADDIVWFLNLTKEKGIVKQNLSLVKAFEAVDRYTVKITLTEPQADLLYNLVHTSMGIFPKECYEAKDCLGNKTVSPGPFLITQNVPRERAVFERNPEFYLKGLPYADRIVIFAVLDATAQKAGYTTGQFDTWITNSFLAADDVAKRVPGTQLNASGGIGGVSTVLRPWIKDGPLADVRVRRALAMTMDHKTMWEAGWEGFTLFPTLISRDYYGAQFYLSLEQAGEWYQFNPTKAKQLLAEAGYSNGFTVELSYSGGFGLYYDFMLFLQSQWKKHLGVDAKVNVVDAVTYNNRYLNGWPGLLNSGACWIRSCWGTADDTFAQFGKDSPQNFQKIDDPKITEIYLKQRGELDPAKRIALLWEFEQYELTQIYELRVSVATAWVLMQPWELNGASHETMWFTALNGPTWMGMHDTSKYPSNRPKD